MFSMQSKENLMFRATTNFDHKNKEIGIGSPKVNKTGSMYNFERQGLKEQLEDDRYRYKIISSIVQILMI